MSGTILGEEYRPQRPQWSKYAGYQIFKPSTGATMYSVYYSYTKKKGEIVFAITDDEDDLDIGSGKTTEEFLRTIYDQLYFYHPHNVKIVLGSEFMPYTDAEGYIRARKREDKAKAKPTGENSWLDT